MTINELNPASSLSPTKGSRTSSRLRSIPEAADEAILLMAHGSRDSEGADEFRTFAQRLSSRLACPIYSGFLELSDPPVVTGIDEAVQAGASKLLAVPWLLLGAGHVKNDLPTAIQWARQRYPQLTIRYGTPINVQPEILSVLGDRLAAIDPYNGSGSPDTALLLVQRGSSDPEANAEVYRAARLLWEGRNFCTVEVAFSGVAQPTIQEGLQRCLLHNPSRVLVLPYFLYTGVLVKRISTIVTEMAAIYPECEFRVARHMGQDTQLEILAQRMIEQVKDGQASMSCDLCQYRVPLFGREAFVGMPQRSDHSHGLRGTTSSIVTKTQHVRGATMDTEVPGGDAGQQHDHAHDHTHDHNHSHENSIQKTWKAVQDLVTTSGIMNTSEITQALITWQSKHRAHSDASFSPYILTAPPGQRPTGALRWDWNARLAHEFAAWCTTTLHERFGIDWQITCEDEDATLGPHYLRMTLGKQEEWCDWHYLNQSHWMGAFCTIADRLLGPRGVTALSLETGWFDTVILFCRSSHAEDVLSWFPEAE